MRKIATVLRQCSRCPHWEYNQGLLNTSQNHYYFNSLAGRMSVEHWAGPCRSDTWGRKVDGKQDFCLLGYSAMQSVESQQTFRRNMSKGGKRALLCYLLHAPSSFENYSTLNMSTKYSSEKSIEFPRITRRHIVEDRILRNLWCQNIKSYVGGT
jgi:hypothetical protein